MARKGNLLYNGDFETGTTEGWVCGAFGKPCQCSFSASEDAAYRGNYGGLLEAEQDNANAYLIYDKVCSFEEYEGYLYIFYTKIINYYYCVGELWGFDDKGNLIQNFDMGMSAEENVWRKHICLIRGYKDITHFKVGMAYWGIYTGDKCYIDEAKLIPLKSIKGHEIKEYRFFDNLNVNWAWFSVISCLGRAKLRSVLQIQNVSGTSPTLDTYVECFMFEGADIPLVLQHSQFTSEGIEQLTIDLPELAFIRVWYLLGGTTPSFDVHHHLILESY